MGGPTNGVEEQGVFSFAPTDRGALRAERAHHAAARRAGIATAGAASQPQQLGRGPRRGSRWRATRPDRCRAGLRSRSRSPPPRTCVLPHPSRPNCYICRFFQSDGGARDWQFWPGLGLQGGVGAYPVFDAIMSHTDERRRRQLASSDRPLVGQGRRSGCLSAHAHRGADMVAGCPQGKASLSLTTAGLKAEQRPARRGRAWLAVARDRQGASRRRRRLARIRPPAACWRFRDGGIWLGPMRLAAAPRAY